MFRAVNILSTICTRIAFAMFNNTTAGETESVEHLPKIYSEGRNISKNRIQNRSLLLQIFTFLYEFYFRIFLPVVKESGIFLKPSCTTSTSSYARLSRTRIMAGTCVCMYTLIQVSVCASAEGGRKGRRERGSKQTTQKGVLLPSFSPLPPFSAESRMSHGR